MCRAAAAAAAGIYIHIIYLEVLVQRTHLLLLLLPWLGFLLMEIGMNVPFWVETFFVLYGVFPTSLQLYNWGRRLLCTIGHCTLDVHYGRRRLLCCKHSGLHTILDGSCVDVCMSYAQNVVCVMCVIVRPGLAVLLLDRIARFGSVRSVCTPSPLVWVVNVQRTVAEGGDSSPLKGVVTMDCGVSRMM